MSIADLVTKTPMITPNKLSGNPEPKKKTRKTRKKYHRGGRTPAQKGVGKLCLGLGIGVRMRKRLNAEPHGVSRGLSITCSRFSFLLPFPSSPPRSARAGRPSRGPSACEAPPPAFEDREQATTYDGRRATARRPTSDDQ